MKAIVQPRYTGYYTGQVLWSKEQRWGDLQFSSSSSSLTSGAEGGAFRKNHKLYVTVGGGTSCTIVSTDGAPRFEGRDLLGHVSFIPAERQNRGSYKGGLLECLSLEIPPNWIAKCFPRQDPSSIEFFPATNRFDPLIFSVMSALRKEAEIGGLGGRLFAETAANLIALHLIRHYSSAGSKWESYDRRQIANGHLEHAFEFIEANLDSDLTLDALANIAGMPISSFVRWFRRATRMSPHKYLMHRRVDRSLQLLSLSNLSISEIAYQLGFSSQSHFSTVFRALIGESPARFRQQFRRK